MKRKSESCGDYADQLNVLTDKAYPELEEEVRKYIALNLDQLQQPQIALAVRQERPRTLTEAVKATLELETFLPRHNECGEDNQDVAVSRQVSSQEADVPVKIDTLSSITTLLENLKAQLTQLEVKVEKKLRCWHPCKIDSHQRGRHARVQAYKQQHFAHKNTKTSHDHRQASEDILSPSQVHQCDSVSKNGVGIIAINSVSNYSVLASVFGNPSILPSGHWGFSITYLWGDMGPYKVT